MGEASRNCLSKWKGDVYNRRYTELVLEVSAIARLFYQTDDQDWIETFENLYKEIDGLTKRRIWHNVKEYLKDFIQCAIKTVKGEYGKTKLKNKAKRTLELVIKPYVS